MRCCNTEHPRVIGCGDIQIR
uniref:Uncharacterized protein n=1 Tax=Arundo donax TaxID=35708 RepID=A0A0A9FIS8_ARUDO